MVQQVRHPVGSRSPIHSASCQPFFRSQWLNNRKLRQWLEERRLGYVLAIASDQRMRWPDEEQRRVDAIAQHLPELAWERVSAGGWLEPGTAGAPQHRRLCASAEADQTPDVRSDLLMIRVPNAV